MAAKKRGLGRGLDVLLNQGVPPVERGGDAPLNKPDPSPDPSGEAPPNKPGPLAGRSREMSLNKPGLEDNSVGGTPLKPQALPDKRIGRRYLNRGTPAKTLFGNAPEPAGEENTGGLLRDVPLDLIQRNQSQPRRHMDQDALRELAQSIRAQGVMQPIILRPADAGRYEIIAGERRWRAAQMAGLETIPALVRSVSDNDAVAMALIENIQREDLNPVEEAVALQRLQQEFDLSHQELADEVGKSRAAVTNLMRLTNLPREVRNLLEQGLLELGHAKVILGLPDHERTEMARLVVARELSVRQTELMVRQQLAGKKPLIRTPPAADPDTSRLQEELSAKLGTGVRIKHGAKGRGTVVIPYSSLDQLDGILEHIK